MPAWTWQASEVDEASLDSVRAYTHELDNVLEPVRVDVCTSSSTWKLPHTQWDVMLNMNMVHIAPWQAAQGLFRAAGELLKPTGMLLMYGPFRFHGKFTADSNAAFDAGLRARDEAWGVRDVDDLAKEAGQNGLELSDTIEMPANNHILLFSRTSS